MQECDISLKKTLTECLKGKFLIFLQQWPKKYKRRYLVEFSTEHFETKHICSTWSADVRVVFVFPIIRI